MVCLPVCVRYWQSLIIEGLISVSLVNIDVLPFLRICPGIDLNFEDHRHTFTESKVSILF